MSDSFRAGQPPDTVPAIVQAGAAAGFQEATDPGRVCVGAARAAYIGPPLDLAPHLNVATTVAFGLRQPLSLRLWRPAGAWGPWQACGACVIPSGTLHHLRAQGAVAFVYLDPLGDDCRHLAAADLDAAADRLRALGTRPGLDALCAALGITQRPPGDARIARVVREIEASPQRFSSLQEAAALACLSPSRFRARFARELGLPFRRYRLWRRMALVLRAIADGRSLTDAALQAGFASSAHLSSAFKAMFGLNPGAIRALGLRLEFDAPLRPACTR